MSSKVDLYSRARRVFFFLEVTVINSGEGGGGGGIGIDVNSSWENVPIEV